MPSRATRSKQSFPALIHALFIPLMALATLVVGIGFSSSADAALQDFSFSGRGTTGSIVFDTSILDSDSHPLNGRYIGAIVDFKIRINGTLENGTGQPTFAVLQGTSGSVIVGIDACGAVVNCLAFFLGSNAYPPTDPTKFDLSFYYPLGSLPSDALPFSVPASGEAILRSDLQQFYLGADATSTIASLPVPEPSTSALLGLGVCLATFMRSRRARFWPVISREATPSDASHGG